MNRQQYTMQVPRRNRRRTDQHARVSGKQGSEECGAEYEDSGGDPHQLTYRPAENVMEVEFHCDQPGSSAGAEPAENPSAHRHGRLMLKNAQHVEEEPRAAEVHDQQNRGEDGRDSREPHGRANKIEMMKQNCSARDHRRHTANAADEKVQSNFPCPDRRSDDGLTVITGFPRNWTTRNIDAAPSNNAFFPSLFAQLVEPLFR